MIKHPKVLSNFLATVLALFYATTSIAGQQHSDNSPPPSFSSMPGAPTPKAIHESAGENKYPDESISAQDEVELTGKFAALARAKGA